MGGSIPPQGTTLVPRWGLDAVRYACTLLAIAANSPLADRPMPSVYLETTIPSFLVARVSQDDGLAEKQAITRTWWDRHRHRYEFVTSEVVLVEAGSGDTSVATQRLLAMQGIRVLADSPEVDFIATELIRRRLLPSKARLDAVHVAFAAVYQVDFLATWNCRHLANTNIRSAIKGLFDELGKHVPVVCTLTELMELRHDH